MKFAYADPPYLGCCSLYKHFHNDGGDAPWDGRCWNDVDTHKLLVEHLMDEYSDGWALSMTSGNLRDLLPVIPREARIGSWMKPFAIFKPNVNPAYTWEPIVFFGGRKGDRTRRTVKDHVICNITLKKGLTGAKPERVCDWILDLLGYEPSDTLVDLFTGTGVMGEVAARRDEVAA